MIIKKLLKYLGVIFLVCTWSHAQEKEVPFSVNKLYNFEKPETLGLTFAKGTETFTVFKPNNLENKYNHGVVLFPFKGYLYAQWQSSKKDEDSDDTQVFYSRSLNGKDWSNPKVLANSWNKGIITSGGWWSDGNTLVAYLNFWPKHKNRPKEGFTKFMLSSDGINWNSSKKVKDDKGKPVLGIIEQDVHSLKSGRLITAFHMQPGIKATPYFTDDVLGISGWTAGKMEHMENGNKSISREIEPSWFYRNDNSIVMIFRDQESTFKKLASISYDFGASWTVPQIIDTPDSRAKQSAGNLQNGEAFMVNNPSGNKTRIPLVITLSKDGFLFDKAFLLRSGGDDLQAMRYEGIYKREGYSYPKSVIWGDYLYISYATNKEDVEITRVPIASLIYN